MKVGTFLISFFLIAALLMYLLFPMLAVAVGISTFWLNTVGLLVYFFSAALVWNKWGIRD